MNDCLRVQNLSLSLGKTAILKKISFELGVGESLAVIGHNGAGKTTLFQVILGFKFAQTGEVRIFGTKAEESEARLHVGYVPERPYFSTEQSLQECLRFFGALHGLNAAQVDQRAAVYLQRFGLQGSELKKMKFFSKGMLQKALLTQALLHGPELLILDEPMSGLDPESREEVKAFLGEWKKNGKAFLFSSHVLEDVASLADRVITLKKGEVQP